MGRKEGKDRESTSLEALAKEYSAQADQILRGTDRVAVAEEISELSKGILSARVGSEQEDQLDRLYNRLNLRKASVFALIPDDARERQAFTLALVGAYQRSLQ